MTMTLIVLGIALLVVIGFFIAFSKKNPRRWTEAECEKAGGHFPGKMTETSGRGRFGTCARCGASVHEHEWS